MSRVLKRSLGVVLAAAVVAVPAAAVAHPQGPGHGPRAHKRALKRHWPGRHLRGWAALACRVERGELGAEAFGEKYGTPRAFRKCLRATRSELRQELRSARQACRAEREDLGAEAFREKYGVPRAFRRCVWAQLADLRQELRSLRQQLRSARQACRTEREDLGGEAFRDKYGVPRAFPRCVSAQLAA
jgi:hypothetical protein